MNARPGMHMDFRRGDHGWLVICNGRWHPVLVKTRSKTCTGCGVNITGRFRKDRPL